MEVCLKFWVVTVGIRALGLSELGDRTGLVLNQLD
jgi:hypothetical protein